MSKIVAALIVIIAFIVGMYFYPQMSNPMACHWNMQGVIDGYMPKFWGIFIFPLLMFVLFVMFITFATIFPRKENTKTEQKYYEFFMVLFLLFLLYVYVVVILANKQIKFNIGQMVLFGLGVLWYYLGIILPKIKRNWLIGIKTPWTLENDVVWEKTHQYAGKLFKITGIATFLVLLVPQYLWLAFVLIIVVVLYLAGYSCVIYKKEAK